MAFWKDGKAEPKEISDLEQLFSDGVHGIQNLLVHLVLV